MIKILLLAANPTDTTRLRLDAEAREIDNALRVADFRDKFVIEKHFAVRVMDLQGLLLRHKPNIVHFSGHGNSANEIIVEDLSGNSHPISANALSRLFSILRENIRCVVLNACYSEPQARAIAQHIDCVVGMSTAIGDAAAISFASSFYQALGYGKAIKAAFDLGCLQINLENLGEQDTPKLLTREGANPSDIYLITESRDTEQATPFAQSHYLYIDSIRNLLKARFSDNTQFDAFCREYFSLEFVPNLPLAWKIDLLIKHCQENQEFNKLLIRIDAFDKKQFSAYARTAKRKRSVDKYSVLWKKWSNAIWKIIPINFLRRPSAKASSGKGTQAEITIEFPIEEFTPEIQAAAINAIAHELHIPANRIKVIDMRQGSIRLTLEIPMEALDKLISAYETDRSALLRDLGISYVMEKLDEPYRLENINALLARGFTFEQLTDFCNKNFGIVFEQLPSTRNADTIAEKLIEYVKQESLIPALLTLAQKYNPKAYDSYGPYYRIARKPLHGAKPEYSSAKLTRKEVIAATARGLGTAILGSMLLSLISIFVVDRLVMDQISSLMMRLFFTLASIYLGDAVGRQVLAGANHKRDPKLGRLAVICYVLGFIVGYSYPLIFFSLFDSVENKLFLMILSICVLPIFILVAVILVVVIYSSSLNGIVNLMSTVINLLLGSFSAYRRTKSYV